MPDLWEIIRAWFRMRNKENEHVGVGIIVQLNYDDRNDGIVRPDNSMNNRRMVSVIYTALVRTRNPTRRTASSQPLNTTPDFDYHLVSNSTVQVDLIPERCLHAVGHIHLAPGLSHHLTLPEVSLENGEGDGTIFVLLIQEILIQAAEDTYHSHECEVSRLGIATGRIPPLNVKALQNGGNNRMVVNVDLSK